MGPCRRRLSRSSQLMDWKNGWALTRLAPPLRLPRRRDRSTVQKERTMSLACSDMGGSWGNVRGLPMILVEDPKVSIWTLLCHVLQMSSYFPLLCSSLLSCRPTLSCLMSCLSTSALLFSYDSALSGHVNLLFVNLNRILMPKRRIPREELVYQNP